ncbi:hypothetical protein ACH0CG_02420 [Microbacterium sp. 179-I 1D1 NHS]|uniref:hypothetical protein n=1 Tax=Microbacterium sp. 179-I 1D1 NHS TaxID=3374298 RepID=UPI003879261F
MWWYDGLAAPGWHDWLALALTVVGFWIAIVQLGKTRSASETAAAELRKARTKLNSDQLAAVVTQMQMIVADIDFAVQENDREVAHRALLRFSYVANESIALLGNLEADHSTLEDRLRQAAGHALDAKSSIVGKKVVDVARTAKSAGNEISGLCVEISGLVAKDRYQIGVAENV